MYAAAGAVAEAKAEAKAVEAEKSELQAAHQRLQEEVAATASEGR